MILSLTSRSRFRIIIMLIIVITAVLTIMVINPMSANLDIDSLDKKIVITDYVALIALVITLIGFAFSLYYRNAQNELLKIQRDYDQLLIAQSNEKSESAKVKSELTEKNNINLKIELEKQKTKYLELYNAVSPRMINTNQLAKSMSVFEGTRITIANVMDGEASVVALSLIKALNEAKWDTQRTITIEMVEGISVMVNMAHKEDKTIHIAKLLVEELNSYNINAKLMASLPDYPQGVIHVIIGSKPNQYFGVVK